MANELDKNLRDWADNAMRPKEPVEPEHHADCSLYVCHAQCDVLWTEIMADVNAGIVAVVNMVNEGNANPEHVVRKGRDD